MPIEIKAWKCKWKCRRTGTKYGTMAAHEDRCWNNPARRTCKACKNDLRDDVEGNYCAVGVDKGFTAAGCSFGEKRTRNMLYDCEKWEANAV